MVKVRIIRPNVIDYNRLLTVSVPVMRLLVGFTWHISAYDPQTCIDFATAASALKHTVHGDCNQFSQRSPCFLATGSGKINR